jgi:hypothetical protein
MKLKHTFTLLAFVLIAIASCKKDKRNVHILKGNVTDGRTGSGLGGCFVEVEQQVLSDGTFGGVYNSAATGSSGSSGEYYLEWERENMVEVRLVVERDDYIERTVNLNPDSFNPDEAVTQNVELYPEAYVQVDIARSVAGANSDHFDFRFDNANFDCVCCNNNWKSIAGANADTTFSCRLYGDTWLKFKKQILTQDIDTLITDSIFCPRFQTSNIQIDW